MMDLRLAALDEPHVDARVTWAVISAEHCVGYVSEYGSGRYRVDPGVVAVPVPCGTFASAADAARALVKARAAAPLLRRGRSGLTVLDERILTAEREWLTAPAPGARDRVAAGLGISTVIYLQHIRWLRDDELAYAYDPNTIRRLRDRHVAAMTRTARLSRDRSNETADRRAS